MNTVVVRCGGCRQLSRVAAEAVGMEVACPRCPVTFIATPEPDPNNDPPVVGRAGAARVPVVHPRKAPPRPVVWELPAEPQAPVIEPIPPTGGLIALAFLPLGIPLLWLLLSAVTGREVVFSFAVPLALAVGIGGVAFGLAHVNRWSLASRVKILLGLLFIGYATTAFLFVVKKEWLEALARSFNNGAQWPEFRTPETETHIGYVVQFPGRPVVGAASPITEWKWLAHQHEDKAQAWPATYLAAGGPVPAEVAKPWQADAAWLNAVSVEVRKADGFALESEKDVTSNQGYKGREFYFKRKDDDRHRIVRLYAVRHQAVYLSVEGPFLTPEHPNVERFLRSLHDPFGKGR